ncbi:hypothetical protein BCR44DRAFT_1323928 [Catenaria anguillulae PL171]|uniref:Uncharacterized protein n=1 Tax=Catenaria anguillulae PL171 TaxID=765915 RepID=A0A1Y2HXD9_9FUNG|nr:hypothetical protein BCR44DRAFT_1323928 [Catenaria anguillulae PL171]
MYRTTAISAGSKQKQSSQMAPVSVRSVCTRLAEVSREHRVIHWLQTFIGGAHVACMFLVAPAPVNVDLSGHHDVIPKRARGMSHPSRHPVLGSARRLARWDGSIRMAQPHPTVSVEKIECSIIPPLPGCIFLIPTAKHCSSSRPSSLDILEVSFDCQRISLSSLLGPPLCDQTPQIGRDRFFATP